MHGVLNLLPKGEDMSDRPSSVEGSLRLTRVPFVFKKLHQRPRNRIVYKHLQWSLIARS